MAEHGVTEETDVATASDEVDIYCEPCSTDRKKTFANGFCLQCDEYLCDTCIKDHKKFSISRMHSVLDQGKMPSQRQKKQNCLVGCIEPCRKHQNEIIKFFCKLHQVLVCSVCITLDHRDCQVEYIPDASTDFRNNAEYLELKKEVDESITNVKYKMRDAIQECNQIDEAYALGINLIKDLQIKMNAMVENKEKELLVNIQTLKQAHSTINASKRTTLDSARSLLDGMKISLIDNKASDIELFSAVKTIKSQLEGINTEVTKIDKPLKDMTFSFKDETVLIGLFHSLAAFEITETVATRYRRCYGEDCLVTASISLGVAYTTLSFIFKHDNIKAASSVQRFGSSVQRFDRTIRDKVPATVLIHSDGRTLESFGYDAEEKYSELAENGTQNDWYFFERFWMDLDESTAFLEAATLKDKSGKEIPVVKVISILIKCLLQSLLDFKIRNLKSKDIHFILTVPANWNTDMENLLKLAVKKTGIEVGHLSIMLESEAAAVYYLHPKSIVNDIQTPNVQGNHTIPGKWESFIICDFQENKLALSLHMMTSDMQMKHIITEYDSTLRVSNVNGEFETFIDTLTGCEAVSFLKMHHIDAYMELIEDFRMKSRSWKMSDRCTFRMPTKLPVCVRDFTGKSINEQIENSVYKNGVSVTAASLRIKPSVFVSLFDPFITQAVDRIRIFIAKHCAIGIKHVFIVSELALPTPLQQGVKTALTDMQVFISPEHDTAVLQGALIWGRELRL
ncbi:uncharacterized protein LOC127879840 isoform X1 [Dreissena polymorpha]|uniref:B box-type domain-containing protein n=1 Tax=Dreissena polymorpha TaxID=45954 RepID=A0A9D4K386_DREPO|nr:uncharacterized protein LOC127879840 isoform X1 [Dreissena polymorpha]KAH3832023.1 hypothetical protein DPMN_105297 [Dreissena polymorpha]